MTEHPSSLYDPISCAMSRSFPQGAELHCILRAAGENTCVSDNVLHTSLQHSSMCLHSQLYLSTFIPLWNTYQHKELLHRLDGLDMRSGSSAPYSLSYSTVPYGEST